MKKHFKKMMALVLVAVMSFALAIPAMAATITITQDNENGVAGAETYNMYKIFDVTKTSSVTEDVTTETTLGTTTATGFAYTIKSTDKWFGVLGSVSEGTWTAAEGQNWITLTESTTPGTYNVSWKEGAASDAAAAEAFAKYLKANMGTITTDATMTATAQATTRKYYTDEAKTTPSPENAVTDYYEDVITAASATTTVDDGYWLITSSLGTNLVLATSNITINTKNDYITDEKTTETASVTVGQNATYYIKVTLPASIDTNKPVTVHDDLDEHLKFNNDVTVTGALNTADLGTTAPKDRTYGAIGTNYTVTTTGLSDDCTFEITIPAAQVLALMEANATGSGANKTYNSTTIFFKYSAELLSTAAADTGYVNKEFSTYSGYKTDETNVEVKTYDFDFTKTDGTNQLNGAVFELRTTATDSSTAIDFIANKYYTDNKYVTEAAAGTTTEFIGAAVTAKKADTDDGVDPDTTVKTKNLVAGDINVSGLGAGTYYLVETIAPAGYNKLEDPITIVIADDGTFTITGEKELYSATTDAANEGKAPDFNVVNNTGSVLPSTGGIGTTIFYVIGAILVIGAGVVLVTRRRMNNK